MSRRKGLHQKRDRQEGNKRRKELARLREQILNELGSRGHLSEKATEMLEEDIRRVKEKNMALTDNEVLSLIAKRYGLGRKNK